MMHQPDLLLLDEPTTGVDPVSRREFWRILARLHRDGKTVLVATPYMDEAERCSDLAFLSGGRITRKGSPADIKAVIPGTLFELATPLPRAALAALAGTPAVRSAHLYGDLVRVLWTGDDRGAEELTLRLLAAGVLALIGLAYGRPHPPFRARVMIWPIVGMLVFAMVQGGSRGALLSLCLGLWMFTLAGKRLSTKIKSAALSMIAIVAVGWMAMQSPLMRKRFEMAESGNLAKREEIFPTAFQLFREKPALGWGPMANQYELGLRLPEHATARRDTHNLVLEVLTTSGLVGTTFFLMGFGLCGLAAWRARSGPAGILPLAMFVSLLVGNMSGNFISFKLYWVMLAFAVGSAALVPRRRVATHRVAPSRGASDLARVGSAPAPM